MKEDSWFRYIETTSQEPFCMAQKIKPMWTGPWRVTERLLNSYTLEMLEGTPVSGEYNARRLREFILREGTELAAEQKDFEAALVQSRESRDSGGIRDHKR